MVEDFISLLFFSMYPLLEEESSMIPKSCWVIFEKIEPILREGKALNISKIVELTGYSRPRINTCVHKLEAWGFLVTRRIGIHVYVTLPEVLHGRRENKVMK